jgi:hypothetical protein
MQKFLHRKRFRRKNVRLSGNRTLMNYGPTNREPRSFSLCGSYATQSLILFVLAGTMILSACGGSSSSPAQQQSGALAGNWQFSLTNPDPNYPTTAGFTTYALQGGFLLQKNNSATGQAVYSVSGFDINQQAVICNAGSATVTGTVSGQSVTINAAAASQTFSLTGTLSSDGKTMMGTYTATAGMASDGSACGIGTGQSGAEPWTATLVPPLTGTITGSFHSAGNGGIQGLVGQEFPVTGILTQGQNTGTSDATITGTLNFVDPVTGLNDYPCISNPSVSVNGQISGDTVILQLIAADGSSVGQIGVPAGQASTNGGLDPVTFDNTTNGYVLHAQPTLVVPGQAYAVNTKACPLTNAPGDTGFICLALNSTKACQQLITISPSTLIFPPLMVGSTSMPQKITITNNVGSAASNLKVGPFESFTGTSGVGYTDFTNAPNFTETDNCSPFPSVLGQSCTVTITFTPQESCTWMPNPSFNSGAVPPAQCPLTLPATLPLSNAPSPDGDMNIDVPITGIGLSAIQPSVPELDFGAWGIGEAHADNSYTQTVSFTNTSLNPITILPNNIPCQYSAFQGALTLTLPVTLGSAVNGLQVLPSKMSDNSGMMSYNCDADALNNLPTFPTSGAGTNSCLVSSPAGLTLPAGGSCSLQVAYTPQANTAYDPGGPDYFLELNTLSCTSQQTSDCELDAARFPVEIKANPASPLRMSPGAGMDFGTLPVGTLSQPLTITLINDPNDPNAGDVTFFGKILLSGNYSEIDDCPAVLKSGGNCTLTVTFQPSAVGYRPGTLTINYTLAGTLALPQKVYLRGMGE